MKQDLQKYSTIPLKYSTLLNIFSDYKSPKDKIDGLLKKEEIVRLKRGLYIVSNAELKSKYSLELIANHLYGPSYISLESALFYYGLIPERVFSVQSVITKRKKQFNTPLGLFEYHKVSEDYFPIGIKQMKNPNDNSFLIASAEKAICDLIIIRKGLRFQSNISAKDFLINDLRLDIDQTYNWDLEIINQCAKFGSKIRELELIKKIIADEFV